MKAKLEFDLPEEQAEFKLAANASGYYSALFEITYNLRKKVESLHYQYNKEETIDFIFGEIAKKTKDLDL